MLRLNCRLGESPQTQLDPIRENLNEEKSTNDLQTFYD